MKVRTSEIPPNRHSLAMQFGSELREAAAPLRAALTRQLDPDQLAGLPLLGAVVTVAFPDRRGRLARSYEPTSRAAIEGALEDLDVQAELRRVDVHVVEDRRRRRATTVELWEARP